MQPRRHLRSSKTKSVVLRKKELLYTISAIILALILFFLFAALLLSDKEKPKDTASLTKYHAGTYTSSVQLNDTTFQVEVAVDDSQITSISLNNMEESVATMYPLVEPAMEELKKQILSSQSADTVIYSSENQYTSIVLHRAILDALEQAK